MNFCLEKKCDESDEDKVPFFREGAKWKNGVRVNNRELQQIISRMMNWDCKKMKRNFVDCLFVPIKRDYETKECTVYNILGIRVERA